jgi:hypothetical protein
LKKDAEREGHEREERLIRVIPREGVENTSPEFVALVTRSV